MIPVGETFISSGEIKVNMDTYISSIPHELQVNVLSYVSTRKDFDGFSSIFNITLSNADYILMILNRFKIYYTQSIINYDLNHLYHGLLWKYGEDNKPAKRGICDVFLIIANKIEDRTYQISPNVPYDQIYELYKYILKSGLVDSVIRFAPDYHYYRPVAVMDDLETLRLGLPDKSIRSLEKDIISNNSKKSLDYMLNSIANREGMDDFIDYIKTIIKGSSNIEQQTLDIILKYNLLNTQDLFDIIILDEHNSWEHLLSKLPLSIKESELEALSILIIDNLYEGKVLCNKFIALWDKYLHKLSPDDIDYFYTNSIKAYSNLHYEDLSLEVRNTLKIITFLANLDVIKNRYKND